MADVASHREAEAMMMLQQSPAHYLYHSGGSPHPAGVAAHHSPAHHSTNFNSDTGDDFLDYFLHSSHCLYVA